MASDRRSRAVVLVFWKALSALHRRQDQRHAGAICPPSRRSGTQAHRADRPLPIAGWCLGSLSGWAKPKDPPQLTRVVN